MFNRLYISPGKVDINAAYTYWANLESVYQMPIKWQNWFIPMTEEIQYLHVNKLR